MLPRRIVALGVGFALLLTLTSTSVAFARDTLIHDGNSGSQDAFSRFATASDTTLVRTTDPTTGYNGFIPVAPNAMQQYACVMLPINSSGLDSFRIAALKNYAEAGGTVVLVGEYAGIPSYNMGLPVTVMNAVASGMGSTMQLEFTTNFVAGFTTTLGSDPLMNNVASIGYNATSTLTLGTGGTALASTNLGQPFMGVDQLGQGRVVMIGDSNVLIDNPDYYTPYGNDTFVKNMCGNVRPPQIVITNPVQDARYKQGQANVIADFACSDPDDRPPPAVPFYFDVLYCSGSFADGAAIDTSVAGNKTFDVDASDKGGNLAHAGVDYVVDGTPPIISITTPADGATYVRRDQYPADFSCVNDDGDPTPPTITFATAPLGLSINTIPTGIQSFTVTCRDAVGNTATLTHEYTVVDESPPDITITSPVEGARFRLNQSVTALFSCTDEDGPADIAFCTGPVPNGGLVPTGAAGPVDFTVNAADLAGNPATKTHHYFVDASPPDITITVPANGGKYPKGSQIIADYSCTDLVDGPEDIVSCNGPVANGAVVDSSAAGSRSFKVDASDRAGNTATKTNTYTILGTSPPSVTIASPVDGATFKQGAAIPLSYSCSDPDGPADIRSCTRVGGTGPLDSSKAGTFEVTARVEDFADNVRTKTHKYTVVAPDAPKGAAAPTKTSTTKACTSRRKFTIRVKKKKGVRIVSATVTVNGKRVKTKKGKRVTSVVTLTGLKKGRYTVVIKAKLSDGRTVTDRRRFKTCTPKGK